MRQIEEIATAAIETQVAAIEAGGERAGYRCADLRDAVAFVLRPDERDLYTEVLRLARGEECEDCGHPMSDHGPDGCERERGDGYIGDTLQALGPCLCKQKGDAG